MKTEQQKENIRAITSIAEFQQPIARWNRAGGVYRMQPDREPAGIGAVRTIDQALKVFYETE